jgi:hypothetical protein
MIKYLTLVLAIVSLNLISCTKDKAPTAVITADCPDTIKFSTQIAPMIASKCAICHDNGTSPTLNSHATISAKANDILKSIKGETQLMPQGGPALNDSLIKQFECWINQGKQNN